MVIPRINLPNRDNTSKGAGKNNDSHPKCISKGAKQTVKPSESTAPRIPHMKLFVPHQLGMIIYKQFKSKNYQGKIVRHDAREKVYKVLVEQYGVFVYYEGGDSELEKLVVELESP